MNLQRQHILLSYFKTLSVGPVWGPNPRPSAQQTGALPTELTRRRYINNLTEELKSNTSPKPFWNYVKSKSKGSSDLVSLKVNDEFLNDDIISSLILG